MEKSADDLRRLPERQLPGEPERDLVEGQQRCGSRRPPSRTIEPSHGACHDLAPVLHGLHRLQADEAQRVIEEMRGGEGEQDEARGEPQSLQEITAGESMHVRPLSSLVRCGSKRRISTLRSRGIASHGAEFIRELGFSRNRSCGFLEHRTFCFP